VTGHKQRELGTRRAKIRCVGVVAELVPSSERARRLEGHPSEGPDCHTRLAGMRTDADTTRPERRRDTRTGADAAARVYVLNRPGFAAIGRIVDTSHSGLGLLLSQEMEPGSLVQIYTLDAILLGEVRSCRGSGEGYKAGVLVRFVTKLAPRRK
jgi:hypothetical protein